MASDACASLYDYLRIKFRIDTGCKLACPLPNPSWKDYKKQWLVLSSHVSPPHCYISYCAHEEEWLMNQELPRLSLEKFNLLRHQPASRTSNKCHLELAFDHFAVFVEFDSMTKLQLWFDSLEKIRCRVFTELVRSPLHPEREKTYVIELHTDKMIFLDASNANVTEFEWRFNNIRRAQFHKHVGKVEVEVGRAAATGEGKFFFIGPNIKHFFAQLKEKIEDLSKAASLKKRGDELPPRPIMTDKSEDVLMLEFEKMVNKAGGGGGAGGGAGGGSSIMSPLEESPGSTGEGSPSMMLPIHPQSPPFHQTPPLPPKEPHVDQGACPPNRSYYQPIMKSNLTQKSDYDHISLVKRNHSLREKAYEQMVPVNHVMTDQYIPQAPPPPPPAHPLFTPPPPPPFSPPPASP